MNNALAFLFTLSTLLTTLMARCSARHFVHEGFSTFSEKPEKRASFQHLNDSIAYLISREFHFDLGPPTEWNNNREVMGHNDVAREIHFVNDAVFEEIISAETKFYDYHLAESSGFVPLKNGYEIAVLKGTWYLRNDTVFLDYQQESIYEFSAYNRYRHYAANDPEKAQKPAPLRNRTWVEQKSLHLTSDKTLCLINGLNRCYTPDY